MADHLPEPMNPDLDRAAEMLAALLRTPRNRRLDTLTVFAKVVIGDSLRGFDVERIDDNELRMRVAALVRRAPWYP